MICVCSVLEMLFHFYEEKAGPIVSRKNNFPIFCKSSRPEPPCVPMFPYITLLSKGHPQLHLGGTFPVSRIQDWIIIRLQHIPMWRSEDNCPELLSHLHAAVRDETQIASSL